MPKKKAVEACAPFSMPEMSKEEQAERFKRDYGFRKNPSVRSTLDGWQQREFDKGYHYMMPKKEITMVEGKPHAFSHRRKGSVYGRTSRG